MIALLKHAQMIEIIMEYVRVGNVCAMMVLKANSARQQFVKIIAIIKDFASKDAVIV